MTWAFGTQGNHHPQFHLCFLFRVFPTSLQSQPERCRTDYPPTVASFLPRTFQSTVRSLSIERENDGLSAVTPFFGVDARKLAASDYFRPAIFGVQGVAD